MQKPSLIKSFQERFQEFFRSEDLPVMVTEDSPLLDVAAQYPSMFDLIERKYGIKIDSDEKRLSLKSFVDKHGLVPAQILFMEIQLNERAIRVKALPAPEAKKFLSQHPTTRVLDVREAWEIKIARLQASQPLDASLLDDLLQNTPKDTPLLLYCHFGIRSLDAATFLADRGFSQVMIIQGGIEAWATDVDPTVPRYEQAYC